MDAGLLSLLLLLLLGLLLLYIIIKVAREHRRLASNDYPPNLARAMLVISEKELAIDRPMRLVGKPDEVYMHPDGYLVPVETKTRDRARIHTADRIQLSVYAVLLRYARYARLPGGPGRAVADYGYVRLVTPKGTLWKVTSLLSETDVARLVDQRIDLEQGRARPRPAYHPSLCRHCPYRSDCPQRVA